MLNSLNAGRQRACWADELLAVIICRICRCSVLVALLNLFIGMCTIASNKIRRNTGARSSCLLDVRADGLIEFTFHSKFDEEMRGRILFWICMSVQSCPIIGNDLG